ncbi:uncharacterized protein LOC131427111 [Malaya genurostris]|uniref:uncharacterized protein LOC131427111 n=1 Tax=Malaya genurostris TaxID=325434 RepID=UPI0026F399E5|nr:uncharacterized protein LOC131427111 [Malaya genurostris]
MAQRLENVVDRRDLLIQKLLRIHEGVNENNVNVHWLNLQLETIRRCNEDSEKIYLEICNLTPRDHRDEHTAEYLRCEELFSSLYVSIQTKLEEKKNAEANQARMTTNVASLNPAIVANSSAPHLQVPLPTFDGNLENWYSFKCMFQTIMRRYPNESPAIKLYHLKNSLIGNAAGKIDQDVINNNNYEAAWKMLEDTYEDERVIIDTHIEALLNLPKLTCESGEELRKLIDTCSKNVDALNNRNLPVNGLAEMMLVNLVAKRLDKETRKLWESQLPKEELPSFLLMIDFLRERCRVLQKVQNYSESRSSTGASKQRGKTEQKSITAKNFVQTSKESCFNCSGEHSIYKCDAFKDLGVAERYNKVKQSGLCFNCLRRGHRTVDCKSEQSCKVCRRKHHSLLHEEKAPIPKQSEVSVVDQPTSDSKGTQESSTKETRLVNCTQSKPIMRQVMLSTAEVLVSGFGNSYWPCRALLDSGSDSNIISEVFAKKLNIPMDRINLPISGLNNAQTMVKHMIHTKIRSRDSNFGAALDFLVVPKITHLPIMECNIQSWPISTDIHLADPFFNVPNEIQMIIGAELFFDLIKEGRIRLGNQMPTLIETRLGWVVSGCVPNVISNSSQKNCHMNVSNEELNRSLTKFWELEKCVEASPLTAAEIAVEDYFVRTVQRSDSGRYIVRLPFNKAKGQLGDSKAAAQYRFNKLLRTFVNNDKRTRYTAFMAEYFALGHMIELKDNPDEGYFLPHHAIYKESSSTTKIRVVFDASAKTTTGVSLNDALEVGPTVQSDLISIIMRFCSHQIVLTADIPKMYRQVQIHEDDRKYQRVLWLNEEHKQTVFELSTVTYGCSSAPYLATRVLVQLATDEANDFPIASNVIKYDSYIDDFLTGGSTSNEVIEIYEQLSGILQRGGFGVHKFCSNSDIVRNHIPSELQETQMNFEDADINNTIKTLGLIWNPMDDYFTFHVKSFESINAACFTKRSVLADMSRLFDPLGFLGPIITLAKIQMQDLWRLGLAWDENLPPEPLKNWTSFRKQLPLVNLMKKNRCQVTCRSIEAYNYSKVGIMWRFTAGSARKENHKCNEVFVSPGDTLV